MATATRRGDRILLELSEEEAKATCSVTARVVVGFSDDNAGKFTKAIFYALLSQLPGELKPWNEHDYKATGSLQFVNLLRTPEPLAPPPLTLADIRTGEWFTVQNDAFPYARLRTEEGWIHFGIFLHQYDDEELLSTRGPIIRLTCAEARALAIKNGCMWPFCEEVPDANL